MTERAPSTPQVTSGHASWAAQHDAYLAAGLERLRLVLERKIHWLRHRGWGGDPLRDYQHLVVSDAQADRILAGTDSKEEHAFRHEDAAASELTGRLAVLDRELSDRAHRLAAMAAPPVPLALAELAGLTDFEVFVLWLALAPELDAGFSRLYAYVQDDAAFGYATPGLAAALVDDEVEVWQSFLPDAPLQRFGLVAPVPGDGSVPLAARPLRLDARMSAYLRGVNHLDERLLRYAVPLDPVPITAPQGAIVARVAAWLAGTAGRGAGSGVNLIGRPGSGRRSAAAALAAALGLGLMELELARLTADPARSELARLAGREALLLPTAIYIEAPEESADPERAAAWHSLVDDLAGLVIVGSRSRVATRRELVPIELTPGDEGRAELWEQALGAAAAAMDLGALTEQFRLNPHGVRRVAAAARSRAELRAGPGGVITAEDAWEASRGEARRRLGDLGQLIDASARWPQLVLPEQALGLLRSIRDQVAHRSRVYHEWGWADRLARGRGVSALFTGPPGTGKTMAAEVLANALQLDLYRIDLSSVVSKYIGETEKNLRRVFDAAELGGAILFFDEADALFGKRTEVKDSHDRYANIEINYLLQRMEDYRGLAVLATNRRGDLDDAFLRRIRFVVTFPFPDPEHRRRIWKVIFPPDTPCEGLDATALARLDIAGGNIRTIAVNASFLAAAAGEPVRMEHVMAAARHEYHKIDKLVTRGEFGDFYEERAP